MKNLSLKCLIVIFLIFSLSCAPQSKKDKTKKIEIMVWGSYKELEIINDTIKIFQKNHPDVKVVISHAPQGGRYIEKILTRAASGTLPDVLFCEVNFIDKFIEKDLLLDLSPFLQKDKQLSEEDFFPQIIKRFKRKNKLFALPRDIAPFACIYYNKSLFDKEGVPYPDDSWDLKKFLHIARRLTKPEKSQYGFYTWIWQNFIYAFGGRIVDDLKNPKKCLLNQKQAIEGMKFYHDLIYKYKVMPPPGATEIGFNEMFMTGKIAMYGSGIWETPIFREIKDFKWDIVMFPKGPGGRGFATGGSGYAIAKTSKHPQLAFELLKLLAGEYGEKRLAQTGLAQPALIKLAYGKFWALDTSSPPANKKMLNKAVKYIIFNPFIPEWGEIEQTIITPRVDLIVRNKIDVEKAMNEMTEEINKILQNRETL